MRISTLCLLLVALFVSTPRAEAFVVAVPATEHTSEPATEAELYAAAAAYKEELKSMTRRERRALRESQEQQIKSILQDYSDAPADAEVSDVLLIILAVLLPPLAVFLHQGEINIKFWISLILTLLFFLPGIIYALLVILGSA